MLSFYSGPQGQSFEISWIFNSRYSAGNGDNSMAADIGMGWKSPIPVGSYVIISYGLISNKEIYDYYRQIDIDNAPTQAEAMNYNSTLWQKIYDESLGTTNGISYQIVTQMTGTSPRLEATLGGVLNADQEPYIVFDDSNPDNPKIFFYLPQSQVMQSPTTEIVGPSQSPNVTIDDSNINKPRLDFQLPRAVRFYYGNFLGERSAKTYVMTDSSFTDYDIGDYYINEATGFVYIVTSKANPTTCTFEYTASIQQPLPTVKTVSISPYTSEGGINEPKVTRSFTNNEQTAWELQFELPRAPKPAINANFIGVTETPFAAVAITDEDTMTFDFRIPKGSRMFAGNEVDADHFDAIVTDAKPGDLYINTNSGVVYVLTSAGFWEKTTGSLKGPTGDALNVVFFGHIDSKPDFTTGRDYILNNYVDEEGNTLPISNDQLFSIVFEDPETHELQAYWYFFTDDQQWNWIPITGGIISFIENEYTESSEDNPIVDRTYSINYINGLIGGKLDDDNKKRVTFSKDQIYNMLSWGDWEDAKLGLDVPNPDYHDTFSADEILRLMSWRSFMSLIEDEGQYGIIPSV